MGRGNKGGNRMGRRDSGGDRMGGGNSGGDSTERETEWEGKPAALSP